MHCGCGMTCWRRLRDWRQQGVWAALHQLLLQRLADADHIDWSRTCLDSASIAAKGGDTVPNPMDRQARDEASYPQRQTWHAARRNHRSGQPPGQLAARSSTRCRAAAQGRTRTARFRMDKLPTDKAYDYRRCPNRCRKRHVLLPIARRGIDSSERLGDPTGSSSEHCLAATLPQAHRPLRAARRYSPGLPLPRLRYGLLQPAHPVLLGALSRRRAPDCRICFAQLTLGAFLGDDRLDQPASQRRTNGRPPPRPSVGRTASHPDRG